MAEKKLVIAVTEEEIKSAIVSKANEYQEIFKGQRLIILAEISGVFIFLSDFIRELPLDVSIKFVAFDKVDKIKNITIDLEEEISIKDENVLIITDVYNKGRSLERLYNFVKKQEPKNLKILSLVNRKNEFKNKDLNVESLFQLSDEKVVGYGLSDNESFRGLKSLYYLKEEIKDE